MKKTKVNSNDKLITSKEIIKKIIKNGHYLFLFIFFGLLVLGFYQYINKETMVSHFLYGSGSSITDSVFMTGEFKTNGSGFVVGNKITIYVFLKFNQNTESYQKLKNGLEFYNKSVFIKNSEDPEDASRDIGENFENISFKDALSKQGMLKVVEFSDENNTIKLKGDVVFTKEGYLAFGLPIDLLFPDFGNNEIGVYVSPAYVKYQIESNKRIELLTFITVAVSFLALFFGFRNQKEK